ncbi:DNA methylase N-4, partial [Devosia subaequoris]|nr:DNA methylase N-4 [Devosia subaequoris]
MSHWDDSLLAIEFNDMLELELSIELNFDFSITGFTSPEVDQLISNAECPPGNDPGAALSTGEPVISELGDLWLLGDHRLIC